MPAVVIGMTIAVLVVATMIWALLDLSRHDVAYLPRWAWAAVIVLLSIVGVGIYLLAGRVPADGGRPLVVRWQQEQDARAAFMLDGMLIGLPSARSGWASPSASSSVRWSSSVAPADRTR